MTARHKLLRTFAARLLGALSFCHARGVAHCCLGAGSVQCSGLEDRSSDRVIVKLDNWGLARLYPGPLEEEVAAIGSDDEFGAAAGARGGAAAGARAGPPPPSPILDEDSDAAFQRQSDLQAAGLLLVECFVAGTAGGPAAAALGGGEALRRLLFEVFHDEITEFRAYCEADVSLGVLRGVGWVGLEAAWCTPTAAKQLLSRAFTASMPPKTKRAQDDLRLFVDFADTTGAWELLSMLLQGETSAAELLQSSLFFDAPAAA
jgi:hypothetical protein